MVSAEMAEPQTLQTVLEELRQLREEREQERQELRELQRRMGAGESGTIGDSREREGQGQSILNFKLKPDTYSGEGSFSEFVAQFEIVARANKWSSEEKALVFAANLRGKARSVLEEVGENINYYDLKSKLELRFGERTCFQNYYLQFTNRKMKFGEEFASFGGDLERLARLAYPECNFELRDKIACAQFIAGLSEGIVRQTLQLEKIVSLRVAIERAKEVSLILGKGDVLRENQHEERLRFRMQNFGSTENVVNFKQRERENFVRKDLRKGRGNVRETRGYVAKESRERGKLGGECWQCGSKGHFRAECPALISQRPK